MIGVNENLNFGFKKKYLSAFMKGVCGAIYTLSKSYAKIELLQEKVSKLNLKTISCSDADLCNEKSLGRRIKIKRQEKCS